MPAALSTGRAIDWVSLHSIEQRPVGAASRLGPARAALLVCLAAPDLRASDSYHLEIAAQTGNDGLTGISADVSINDSGHVSFVGWDEVGSSIRFWDVSGGRSAAIPSIRATHRRQCS